MVQSLAVASGKGGVGKSSIASNLGITLAKAGKTVVLVDLDLGGSNLHTFLGIKNDKTGIGSLVHKKETRFNSLICSTPYERLFIIPGDEILPGTANLAYYTKRKIIKELGKIPCDYVIMDLSSGSSYNVVDFFLSADFGLLVTTPEITSILNAYSFLKTGLFRLLHLSFPPKSPERNIIFQFATDKVEGTDKSFLELKNRIRASSAESAGKVNSLMSHFTPRVILNNGSNKNDLSVGARLRDITTKNLGIKLDFIGYIRNDPVVERSIAKRTPAVLLDPDCGFSKAIHSSAQKLMHMKPETPAIVHHENTDHTMLQDPNSSVPLS